MSLVAAAVVSTGVYAEDMASEVEVSANMALTSNYVWRGMTQNSNTVAVQGGIDLGYKGFYVGVWASPVDFGDDANIEVDLYAGYAGEVGQFSYDVGYCQYTFPGVTETNMGEAYLSLGYDFDIASVSATYYNGVKTDDTDPTDAYEGSVSVPLPMDVTLDATYGDYDDIGNYYLVGLTKSFGKFDISLAYTGMEYDDNTDEDNVVATISTSF